MLFRRRNPPHWLERLRVAVWPRHSFARSAKYFFKRVLRLSGSPHAVAAGFAVGAFVSCTPFMGFHFIISVFLAFFVGGNALAAMLGTSVGNPLTFPFIWASTFEVGSLILGRGGESFDGKAFKHGLMEGSTDILWPIIKPMLVGAVPIGLVIGVIFYFLIFKLVRAYQARRVARFNARIEELRRATAADNEDGPVPGDQGRADPALPGRKEAAR